MIIAAKLAKRATRGEIFAPGVSNLLTLDEIFHSPVEQVSFLSKSNLLNFYYILRARGLGRLF